MSAIAALVDTALKTWSVLHTPFLPPDELAAVLTDIGQRVDVHAQPWGGYPQAERCRLAIAPAELSLDDQRPPLALVRISGNFLFDPATYIDFESALEAAGVAADDYGDIILLGERGAQAIVNPDSLPLITTALKHVRTVPVSVAPCPWDQLAVAPPQTKHLTTVEASLRLDAVASAGFGLSRSKMSEWISNGMVRVNWHVVQHPRYAVKVNDLITIRGKGRLVIHGIQTTKKNRYRLQMERTR
ncbi:photosystem II S4 domain protein [Parathermosynechococcus lividus]